MEEDEEAFHVGYVQGVINDTLVYRDLLFLFYTH